MPILPRVYLIVGAEEEEEEKEKQTVCIFFLLPTTDMVFPKNKKTCRLIIKKKINKKTCAANDQSDIANIRE